MFYVYIVLSNTIILTGIIYCLQIVFGWWGSSALVRKERRTSRRLKMGKPLSKQKKSDDGSKDSKEKSENNETTDNEKTDTNKGEEKLTVQIITNKEPVIEKIDEEQNENEDSGKLLRFCALLRYRERKHKIVNFDKAKWSGEVSCVINKNIKIWSKSNNSVKKDVKTTESTHEFVKSSWEQSFNKHINSRSALINSSNRLGVKDRMKFWWANRSFKTYSIENFSLKSVNKENRNLISYYSISHVKKRRKPKKRKCFHCGKT